MASHQRPLRHGRSTGCGSGVSGAVPGDSDGNDTARFGHSALNANEYDGQVNVNRNSAERLSIPYDNEGGRAAVAVHME
ncbi:hypothetical protein HY634_00405 [Candidatus Uhrbacteria bacterium]|nr:hypothetical protein [Candidatus Uhrbacteria bacterium]